MTTARTESTKAVMPDIQSEPDRRRVAIDKVGVKEIKYPVTLARPDGELVETVAGINMYVSLPAERKGTHMSRFLEALNEYRTGLQPERIIDLCRQLRTDLDAADAHVEMDFPYFITKEAPVTGLPGLMDYPCRFVCEASDRGEDFIMSVSASATSLCPCSKEIAKYGAHNQRCLITADIRFDGMVWIEELASHIEAAASCPVYSVLKRPDEKLVTELAFENPKFVEDIVRDLALILDEDSRITWYHVRSENFESIHSHNAYAEITRDKR
ncbi:MAG: GTP cyclohydrolase FolE2 [Phycisphaerales bacterium]|nr:GTP cyclohydrolase FolE2 [Phycisphaerales bacterium]